MSTPSTSEPQAEYPPLKPYWEYQPTTGPAKLYSLFASQAVDDLLLKKLDLPDEIYALISDAVEIAVSVVCHAAGVETSWYTLYNEAIEAIKSEVDQ